MSKNFACCELVQRIKDWQVESKWSEKEKYRGVEFLRKAALKIVHKGKNESGAEKNVWDSLFCDKCKEWFKQQEALQTKLIDAEIEKEKAEGTFYSNPAAQKALEESREKVNRWSQKMEKNNSCPFGKSPQE